MKPKKKPGWLRRWGLVAAFMALGAATGDWLTKRAYAASPDGTCRVQWYCNLAGYCPWSEYGCIDGVYTLLANGWGYIGSGLCYDHTGASRACPDGWDSRFVGTAWTVGDCDILSCGSTWGCSGPCNGYCFNGAWNPSGGDCTGSGCSCIAPDCSDIDDGITMESRAGVCGVPPSDPCTGNCNYTAMGFGEQTEWVLTSNSCSITTGCGCPLTPSTSAGACPELGATTSVACGSEGGAGCVPECNGNCVYTSVQSGEDVFSWLLSTWNCTSGAEGCGCPASPLGPCPSSEGLEKIVACGAASGDCTPVACEGGCTYVAMATSEGGFEWALSTHDCAEGATECGCPDDPGGDCPVSESEVRIISCGEEGTPCKDPKCHSRGGDADEDGCCADEDLDDDDPAVCASVCKGSCRRCYAPDPEIEGLEVPCDPSTYAGEGDCTCVTEANGDRDGDRCCDCQDDWPDDPERGCDCCDYYQIWLDNGGDLLQNEWRRIIGGSESATVGVGVVAAKAMIAWNPTATPAGGTDQAGGPGTWEPGGDLPAGEPDPVAITVPLAMMSSSAMADTTMYLPVTCAHVESMMSGWGLGSFTGFLGPVNSFRQWFRVALAFIVFSMCVQNVFHELRV